MDLTKVAYTILLLIPGFLFVKAFNWSARPRRVTDFELTVWSLFLSLAILIGARYILQLRWYQPHVEDIVANPVAASNGLRLTVIAMGLVGGWLVGRLDRTRWVPSLLLRVGFDLRHSLDLWQLELGTRRYVSVWLKDGTLLYGWPVAFSSNRRETAEVSLSDVQEWDKTTDSFAPYDPNVTVLLDLASINYIVLHPRQFPDQPQLLAVTKWLTKQRQFWFNPP